MPDEITPPPAFVPYELEIDGATYSVLEPSQPDAYRVREPGGQVIGLACADSSAVLSAEALAVLLAMPQIVPVVRRQETRVILDRLTTGERAALFNSANTDVRTLVAKALATGAIRDDDPDFPAAVAGLNALGIVASSRWDELLA